MAAEDQDTWVGVALDAQIQPNSSNPATVDGLEIAIWKAESGPAQVWRDRCPHRGMRLSYGFVRDGALRCIYHGWTYDTGGKCVSVPAHPDLVPPKSICAQTYGAQTKHGIIWANLSDTRDAKLPELDEELDWLPIRSLYLPKDADSIIGGIKRFDDGVFNNVQELAAGVYTISLENGAKMLVSVQCADAQNTALHIVAQPGSDDSKAFQIQLAKRMERMRRALAVE